MITTHVRQHTRTILYSALVAITAVVAGCGSLQISTSVDSSEKNTDTKQKASSSESENGDMKPFNEIVPDDATTDDGLITTHRTDEHLYFGIPDSLLGREILTVSRVSKTQNDLLGAFGGGGFKVSTRVLRWERRGDQVLLRVASYEKTANPDDPVYEAVQNSSFEPIPTV